MEKRGWIATGHTYTSLHEMIQIGLNMFGLWVVDLIDLTVDKLPDLHPTFPRGV
jgi:hypothetical protein